MRAISKEKLVSDLETTRRRFFPRWDGEVRADVAHVLTVELLKLNLMKKQVQDIKELQKNGRNECCLPITNKTFWIQQNMMLQ